MLFSSLFSQPKCSTWSQVMFSGVGLLMKCLNFLPLRIESSPLNLILKKWYQFSSMHELFCLGARKNTLNKAFLCSYDIVFLWIHWTWGSAGVFWCGLWNVSKDGVCLCTQTCPWCCILLGYESLGFGPHTGNSIFHERWWDEQGICCKLTQRVNNNLYSFQVLYYPDCHLNPGWHYSPST